MRIINDEIQPSYVKHAHLYLCLTGHYTLRDATVLRCQFTFDAMLNSSKNTSIKIH